MNEQLSTSNHPAPPPIRIPESVKIAADVAAQVATRVATNVASSAVAAATAAATAEAATKKKTGPHTPEGKQKVSMNAFQHGLTGIKMIVLPEEQEAYHRLTEELNDEFRPGTATERQLVLKIIDCHTRLNRVAALENNLWGMGTMDGIEVSPYMDSDPNLAIVQGQTKAWNTNANNFDKLGRYEARLSKQLLAYTRELEHAQEKRRNAEELGSLKRAAVSLPVARTNSPTAHKSAQKPAPASAQPAANKEPIDIRNLFGNDFSKPPANEGLRQVKWGEGVLERFRGRK